MTHLHSNLYCYELYCTTWGTGAPPHTHTHTHTSAGLELLLPPNSDEATVPPHSAIGGQIGANQALICLSQGGTNEDLVRNQKSHPCQAVKRRPLTPSGF